MTLADPIWLLDEDILMEYFASDGSWMFVNSSQYCAVLYADIVPQGIYTGINLETPRKVPLYIVGGVVASHVIEAREEQSAKANSPMLVTPFGIVIEVREEQAAKAPAPIFVTLLPMLTEVKEEHSEKAPPPMLVTLLGIVREVREKQ